MACPIASRHRNAAPLRTLARESVSKEVLSVIAAGSPLTLSIRSEGRKQPVHVGLRQGPRRLYQEVREERRGVERIVPVDMAGVAAVEPDLHDDGPDVDAGVEDHDRPQPELRSSSLADAFEIEDES